MSSEIKLNDTTNKSKIYVGGDRDNHFKLKNLEFDNSGHVGFQRELTSEQLENITAVPNKVDKVEGKGLSSNDYTASEKTKLQSLPTSDELTNSLNLKVDKEDGKGLSTNDYTDEEKAKVDKIDTIEADIDMFNAEVLSLGSKVDNHEIRMLEVESRIGNNEVAIENLITATNDKVDISELDNIYTKDEVDNAIQSAILDSWEVAV